MEIFLTTGRTYLLAFPTKQERNAIYSKVPLFYHYGEENRLTEYERSFSRLISLIGLTMRLK